MDTMNLTSAILAHLNWKSKLSDFFYGVEELSPADVPDPRHCEFGKLLASGALNTYEVFADMTEAEALHNNLHEDIKRLVAMPKEKRMSDEGKQALATFKAECDKFIALLEHVEKEAQRQ